MAGVSNKFAGFALISWWFVVFKGIGAIRFGLAFRSFVTGD